MADAMLSSTRAGSLEEKLEKLDEERERIKKAEAELIDSGMKKEYLEIRKEAQRFIRDGKFEIEKIQKMSVKIMAVKDWKLFFSPYECVIIQWAAEGWFYRIMQFLAGDKDA